MNTKDSIVEVATRLFAAKGLDGVTVREICRAARVNVALVNYHFHSKEGLYRECVERLFRRGGSELVSAAAGVADARTWRAAVVEWVRRFSGVMRATTGTSALAGGIYRQEVIHPSSMRDFILREYVKPVRDGLLALLRMSDLDEERAHLWTSTIWAELSAHAIADASWRDTFRPPSADAERWADSFVEFVTNRIFRELKYHA